MKIKTVRQGEYVEHDFLVVSVGDCRYRISEEIDGKLCINKSSDGHSDMIAIHPVVGNEIKLS